MEREQAVEQAGEIAPLELTVAAVARRIGVAPATLRTWDRRYGLGPTAHEAGSHRRYTEEDLARLTQMRFLITSGYAPGLAAAQALKYIPEASSSDTAITTVVRDESELVALLMRASNAMDRALVEDQIAQAIDRDGVAATWSNVLVPLLREVGEDWAKSGKGIEIEHMLSGIIARALAEASIKVTKPVNSTPVLLACVGEEIHSLAIHALAACLAEDSIQVQYLGARTPQSAINETVRRSQPPAVFLWAQLSANAHRGFIDEIPAVRPAPRVVLGGPGWSEVNCEKAYVAHDLASARQEIARAVGILSH
jgi:DNA-binding transcriptional MerR regulator